MFTAVRFGLAFIALFTLLNTAVTGQPALTPVRVVTSANDDATPVLYALSTGMFRAAGLDVQVQAIASGTIIASAVSSGSADIGRASVVAVAVARSHGLPFTIIAPSGLALASEQTIGVVVPKESPIADARALNGTTVSVPNLSEVAALSTRAWVDKNGGDSQTVHFIETPGPQVAVALDTGRINAATMLQPLLGQSVATGKYRVLGDPGSSIARRYLAAVWFATTSYTAQNPDVVRRFVAVLNQASQYCNAHPQQTIALLAKFSGLDPATIANINRVQYATSLDPRDIQPLLDVVFKYKLIPAPIQARDLMYVPR